MDHSFFLRAQRLLDERQPARLDVGMLRAAVAAQQAASPTAKAHARLTAGGAPAGDEDSLAELLLAGDGWRDAAAVRRGCFSRAGSGRHGNGS